MRRCLISVAFGSLLVAAATAGIAAPQTQQPGQMTQARVWVQNRGKSDAVSVDLREVTLERPMKVHLTNGEAGDGDALIVQARAVRQGWDYDTITVASGANVGAALRDRGGAGWEAVGIVSTADATTILLKRPR